MPTFKCPNCSEYVEDDSLCDCFNCEKTCCLECVEWVVSHYSPDKEACSIECFDEIWNNLNDEDKHG